MAAVRRYLSRAIGVMTIAVTADPAWAEHVPTPQERELLYIMAVVFVLALVSFLLLGKIAARREPKRRPRRRWH
jgi:hypothetical protein